ncbi:hypothetical protein ACIRNI_22705 [Streptomyces sp. NPDC093546]|uniref:hypothetical protein n=1 Tax=Streptomyces sp. NPDC093546 TaxID=3366040 RepID=UPI0038184B35
MPCVGGPLDEAAERFVRAQTLGEDVLQGEQGMRDGDGGELVPVVGGVDFDGVDLVLLDADVAGPCGGS